MDPNPLPDLECRSARLTASRNDCAHGRPRRLSPPRNDGYLWGCWFSYPSLRVQRSNPGGWVELRGMIWAWCRFLDCHVGLRPPRNDGSISLGGNDGSLCITLVGFSPPRLISLIITSWIFSISDHHGFIQSCLAIAGCGCLVVDFPC